MTETNVPASGAEPEVGVEVPEADAAEQAQGEQAEAATPRTREIPDEVPEADAVEQLQGGDAITPASVRSIPDDVPVADALEQAYEVELEEDY